MFNLVKLHMLKLNIRKLLHIRKLNKATTLIWQPTLIWQAALIWQATLIWQPGGERGGGGPGVEKLDFFRFDIFYYLSCVGSGTFYRNKKSSLVLE